MWDSIPEILFANMASDRSKSLLPSWRLRNGNTEGVETVGRVGGH